VSFAVHRRIAPLVVLLGSPIVWGLQEWVGWYLASSQCPGAGEDKVAHMHILMNVATNVAFMIAAIALLAVALVHWSRARSKEMGGVPARDRRVFVAGMAVLSSTVFALAVAWGSLAPLVLAPCVSGR
jgi:hypothetical protein